MNRDHHTSDPLVLLRLVVGALLVAATAAAAVLWAVAGDPRMLALAGVLWALYGLLVGFVGGVLEPALDLVAAAFQNAGLRRAGGGYSAMESLVARGEYRLAAEAYLERARAGRGDAEALARRAELLAERLGAPEAALAELEAAREGRRLRAAEDFRIGLAIAEIAERRLGDAGRAAAELRRLIDRHPSHGRTRELRETLRALEGERLPAVP